MTACKTCGIDTPYDGLWGMVSANQVRDKCVACNKGEKVSTSTGFCTDCAKGREQQLLTYQTTCPQCVTGKFADVTGLETCKSCAAGKYQNEVGKDACKSCTTG